jgi:phage terminase small subunit
LRAFTRVCYSGRMSMTTEERRALKEIEVEGTTEGPDRPTHFSSQRNMFCNEFVKDGNGTAAAMRAGYSEKSARQISTELLGDPQVQERIHKAFQRIQARTQVSAEKVVREYARLAFANMSDVAEWGGGAMSIKASGELDEDVLAAVSEVIETTGPAGSTTKVKLFSKTDALNALSKHLGMFVERSESEININVNAPEYAERSLEELMELRDALRASKVIDGEVKVLE